MSFTQEEEARMTREHFEKYDAIAKQIGIQTLKRFVPVGKERIVEALKIERNLNSIPLRLWDRQNMYVRRKAFDSGIKVWSLSYTVCVLKHVAREYIAKEGGE